MARVEDLPGDVIYLIFLQLSDFSTLSSILMTSKRHFYDVYKANQTTINAAIAWNMVGPALPSAARVLFCKDSPLPSEDDLRSNNRMFGQRHCRALEENAVVVAKYEDLFSIRYAYFR